MNRWKTALLLPLALTLGGCVTYPTYTYYGTEPVHEVRSAGGGSYYSPAAGAYGDYYGSYGYGSAGYRYYAPDYVSYSAYYSLFWPLRHWYHDPYWYPGFHYGVTYFPRNYFSVSFHSGWRGHGLTHWSHGGAYRLAFGYSHWYSPYRYSWIDSYYDWDRYRFHYRDNRAGHGHYSPAYSQPRFGHARNAAERLAWQERERSGVQGDGIATGIGLRAPSVYGNARPPSRGADYGRGEGEIRRPGSLPVASAELPTPQGEPVREWRGANDVRFDPGREGNQSGPRLRGGLRDRGFEGEARDWRRERVDTGAAPRGTAEMPALQFGRERSEGRPVREIRDGTPVREFRGRGAEDWRRTESTGPREYRSEPRAQRFESAPRGFAPAEARMDAAPRHESTPREEWRSQRVERGGRGSDFGGSPQPSPAPRAEFRREPEFRAPASATPREAPPMRGAWEGEGRRSSAEREDLQFE